MAGHSKWSNIQHRKSRQDAKRSKIFTKLIREITVAARLGDSDPNSNPRLRLAVDKALAQNMTKDTIARAIKRGAGGEDGSHLENIRYEGYGPAGVAMMVDCLTDNKNRTVADVRHAFTKCGGNLGTDGSVAYLFSQAGLLSFTKTSNEEQLMELAIEAGAQDVVTNEDGSVDIITTPEEFTHIKTAITHAGFKPNTAEVTQLASTSVTVDDLDLATNLLKLNEMLEDLDDVQNVYSNAEIPENILNQLN